MVGKTIKQYRIPSNHFKRNGNKLIIRMRKNASKENFHLLLPMDLFSRDHYFSL